MKREKMLKLIERSMAKLDAKKQHERRWQTGKAMATRKARDREIREARAAKLRDGVVRQKRKLPVVGWRVLLARMEPGREYTFAKLAALVPEYTKQGFKAWLKLNCYDTGFLVRRGEAGGYLYSMSTAGQKEGQEARIELGLMSDTV